MQKSKRHMNMRPEVENKGKIKKKRKLKMFNNEI